MDGVGYNKNIVQIASKQPERIKEVKPENKIPEQKSGDLIESMEYEGMANRMLVHSRNAEIQPKQEHQEDMSGQAANISEISRPSNMEKSDIAESDNISEKPEDSKKEPDIPESGESPLTEELPIVSSEPVSVPL